MAIIPLSDRTGYIWLNGEFIEWKKAQIHILTHSLHYGGAVFEGIRAYNGKIFKLKDHIDRLIASASMLKYSPDCTASQIMDAALRVITLNNLKDCYIRPLIWKGSESQRISSSMLSINTMVAAWEVSSREFRKPQIDLVVSNWIKAHPNSLNPWCKSSANYQISSIAQHDAIEDGYDDALLLDYRGFVGECTVSNIFFVDGNKVITPLADCVLKGITRSTVMGLARKAGFEVEERIILPEEMKNFSEAFITGTAVEVKPINSITFMQEKISYNNDEITPKIIELYKELVTK